MLNSTSTKYDNLNYGLDIHYAFFIKNSRVVISPFVGFEGMTLWRKVSWTYLDLVFPGGLEGTTVRPPISKKRDYETNFAKKCKIIKISLPLHPDFGVILPILRKNEKGNQV